MMRDETERAHLEQHAEQLKSSSEGERRRVRKEARDKARTAYVRMLEQTVVTNESESATLQELLRVCTQDRLNLSYRLQLVRTATHTQTHALSPVHPHMHAHTHNWAMFCSSIV